MPYVEKMTKINRKTIEKSTESCYNKPTRVKTFQKYMSSVGRNPVRDHLAGSMQDTVSSVKAVRRWIFETFSERSVIYEKNNAI